MAEEAIRCIIESNTKLGEPTPLDVISDQEPIKEQVAVKIRGLMAKQPVVSNLIRLSRQFNVLAFISTIKTGSHVRLIHRTESHRRGTIPMHNEDLKKGTLKSILHQAELSVEEFIKYL